MRHLAQRARLLLTIGLVLAPAAASAQALLIPKDPALPPLALKHHRVEIAVKNGTAVTRIEQVYLNSTSRPLEATYVFPVPEGAAVMGFRLMVNGKMQRGEVLDKSKANRIYSDIVRRLRDPGIVDWLGKDLFKVRIFPVPASGEQRVEITYTQPLPFLDGTYKLSYPLKTSAAAARTLEDLTLTATIASKTPIKTVYSPTHRVSVSRKGDHRAVVGFEGERVALDQDFTLYFGVSKKDIGLNLLTYREQGEPGFFLLMAAPKAVFDTDEIQGKAITFVLDTSGSMTGAKLEQAKRALTWSLDHLGDDDRFNVVRFSSDVEAFEPRLVAASARNIEAAKRFVDSFEAAGGTAIDDALAQALGEGAGQDTHLVLFITDGRPTVGQTEVQRILANATANNRERARVFALGIGDDINTHLLDKLAGDNGGTSAYVKPSEDMDAHIAALYNQIAFPVLTDVALDVSKVRTYGALPGRLPDVFRGGQLLVIGRYRGQGDALIRLTGRMNKQSRQFDFEATFPGQSDDHAFIASLWAHRQVGQLLDQIRLSGETEELREEVIQLAKKYGIVTPYTSYLVVEEGAATARPPRPVVPRRRHAFDRTTLDDAALPSPSAAPAEERERVMRDAARGGASGRAFTTKSGKRAVEEAKAVRLLKDKERAGSEVTGVKYVAGKVFSYRAGQGWVDRAYTSGLKEVRIAPFSDAWIATVTAIPKLKEMLALGERVTVRLGAYALIVAPGGQATVDDETVARLKRAAR